MQKPNVIDHSSEPASALHRKSTCDPVAVYRLCKFQLGFPVNATFVPSCFPSHIFCPSTPTRTAWSCGKIRSSSSSTVRGFSFSGLHQHKDSFRSHLPNPFSHAACLFLLTHHPFPSANCSGRRLHPAAIKNPLQVAIGSTRNQLTSPA